MKKFEHFLWVEKYRPKKIEDCILPEMLKMQFKKFVESESIPNLIFSGPPGTGKTTVALAMIDEIGADSYMINASLYGNIETLRNELEVFASSVSTNGKRKYVVLDESDKTSIAFQEGLRAFIEEYSKNTGFILTCNYKTRLIEAIHSRCPSVDFNIPKTEIKEVMKQSFIRMANILTTENIKFDKPILLDVIKKFFPDMRRVIGELQKYGQATGEINSGIVSSFTESRLQSLISHMKEKDFTKVRIWVNDNSDIEPSELFRKFYEQAASLVTTDSIPMLVITLARYQEMSRNVADQDINTSACLAEIMVDVTWK